MGNEEEICEEEKEREERSWRRRYVSVAILAQRRREGWGEW